MLAKHGLSVAQGGGTLVEKTMQYTTMLLHTSGEWLKSTVDVPLDKITPQGLGSAITYARRYGLAAMLGMVADEDDDGQAAEPKSTSKPVARPKPAPTPKPAPKSVAKPLPGGTILTAAESSKIIATFAGIDIPLGEIEQWLGKPMNEWTEDDKAKSRRFYSAELARKKAGPTTVSLGDDKE